MKKILLLAAVACMATITSCKKDYTCECTTTSGSSAPGGTTSTSVQDYPIRDKKDAAKTTCDALAYDYSSGTSVSKNVCVIK